MATLSELFYPDTDALQACCQLLTKDGFHIVALDGRDGAGKTTLGHYLALRSGRQFLDLDLYLKRRKSAAPTHTKDLAAVLNRWKRNDRPIILAGIFVGESLKSIGFSADLMVRVVRVEQSGNDSWAESYAKYEEDYAPDQKMYLPCLGAERPDKKCFMLHKEALSGSDTVGPCIWCEAQSQIDKRNDRPWWD